MNSVGVETNQEISLFDLERISFSPWRTLRDWSGVQGKFLWGKRRDGGYAALLRLDPFTRIPPHNHQTAGHHMWVVQGSCRINQRILSTGDYCFIPSSTDHGVKQAGADGCTFFFVYLLADPQGHDDLKGGAHD